MKNDFEASLGILSLLTEALTVPRSLDEALTHITTMTCSLMETEQAVFLFRDEERKELYVKTVVGIDSPNIRVGHALCVPPRLHNILWQLKNAHQVNWIYAGIDDISFPIICTPITVRGSRIGLLIAGGVKVKDPNLTTPYDGVRRKIFSLIAHFASLVIENSKVYDYLKQHFAASSQELRDQNKQEAESRDRDEAEQLMVTSLKNPTKVIKLLTESYFKELANAGFTAGHIAIASAHLLELITQSDVDSTGRLTLPTTQPQDNAAPKNKSDKQA